MDIQTQKQEIQDKVQSDIRLPETDNNLLTPDISSDLSSRYQLIKKVGHGSQGKVYLAERVSDGIQVAIKVLQIDSIQNWKEYDLFWREVNTLKSLDIEGVAKFYEVIEQLDTQMPCAYLVQQFISGQSLADMLHDGYRFDIKTVFEIGIQLVNILEQLHQHDPQIIHRDIKPSNIMIETDNGGFKVYLTDFGAVANPLLQKGGSTVAGTYGYMPPEQLMGKTEPASDIYALGATLAGILSGMEPSQMAIADYRLAFETHLENLPYAIVSCLRQMTQPKIEDRLCDCSKLHQIFSQFKEGNYSAFYEHALSTKSDHSFYKRLHHVHVLGKQENFELWNQLPESTPRQYPGFYRISRHKTELSPFWHWLKKKFPITSPAYFIYSPLASINKTIRSFFEVLCLFIVISSGLAFLGSAIGCFYLFFLKDIREYGIWHYDEWGCAFLIPIVLILCGAAFIYVFLPRCLPNIQYNQKTLYNSNHSRRTIKRAYHNLLKNGRKTLATVLNVKYIGIVNGMGWFLNDKDIDFGYHAVYNLSYPRIRLTYAFNPPDDSSSDDIVHSVVIPADSEKYLKSGDLLPILYTIDKDDNSIVNSMPFPLPISDPMNIFEMICLSHNKKEDKP